MTTWFQGVLPEWQLHITVPLHDDWLGSNQLHSCWCSAMDHLTHNLGSKQLERLPQALNCMQSPPLWEVARADTFYTLEFFSSISCSTILVTGRFCSGDNSQSTHSHNTTELGSSAIYHPYLGPQDKIFDPLHNKLWARTHPLWKHGAKGRQFSLFSSHVIDMLWQQGTMWQSCDIQAIATSLSWRKLHLFSVPWG